MLLEGLYCRPDTSEMLPAKAGKALKKIKARLARGGQDGVEATDKLRSSWMGVSTALNKMSLEEALAEDKKHEQREEQNIRWFHFNTNRNLAEYKLKDGEWRVPVRMCK